MSAGRLRLLQLVSPALPVGAFSYSEGLEALVQEGRLIDAPGVRHWLEAELARGTLAVEAAALAPLTILLKDWRDAAAAPDPAAAVEAAAAVADLDGWLLAHREAPELRAQQRQMGQSLLQLLAELGWPLPVSGAAALRSPLAWTCAWAWAGLALELDLSDLVEAYLFGWVANQLSAAVRLVPLGTTQAQGLQLGLGALIASRAAELVRIDPGSLHSGGVGAGLAQLRHDELYSRLFRS
jgi:urease accessory protein